MPLKYIHILCLLIVLLSSAACRPPQISTYTIPRTEPSSATTISDGVSSPVGTTGQLTWTAPDSWQPKPLAPARRGSFKISGLDGTEADFAITSFPGDVGGEAANINRWCGQIGLPALRGEALDSAILRLEHNGLKFAVVDLSGSGQRIVGAIVPYGEATWFFKLLGPDALVAAEKSAFLALLQTIRPSAQ